MSHQSFVTFTQLLYRAWFERFFVQAFVHVASFCQIKKYQLLNKFWKLPLNNLPPVQCPVSSLPSAVLRRPVDVQNIARFRQNNSEQPAKKNHIICMYVYASLYFKLLVNILTFVHDALLSSWYAVLREIRLMAVTNPEEKEKRQWNSEMVK